MRIILLYFALPFHFLAYGQDKGDYNWQLGAKSNPISNPYPTSLEMRFDSGFLYIDTFYRDMYMGYFNASISDSNGNLLLYSNGCQINNGNHELILGSEHLNPGSVDDEWCGQSPGDYPIADGGLFLPFKNDSLILLLHQRQRIEGPPLRVYVDALFYTSLFKEGTSYSIIEKSIPIVEDSLSEGRLEAIQGDRPGYWWIIQGKRNSNIYYSIGIEFGQIDTVFTKAIGDTTVKQGEAAAQSVFAPDGSRYARYSPADDLFLFDFDRSTGLLSNYSKIHVADSGIIGGLAFSSNSQFLYANSKWDLYQFDVFRDDIENSKVHIAHYDGFASPFPTTFYHMQLGPDCRIYMIPPNGANTMHVINSPNEKGKSSNFTQHSLVFPTYNTITLPNFPVFRSLSENPCDSSLATAIPEIRNISEFSIYPNPTPDVAFIKSRNETKLFQILYVSIYSSIGVKVFSSKQEIFNENGVVDLSHLPSGLYYINIHSDNFSQVEKIIKL